MFLLRGAKWLLFLKTTLCEEGEHKHMTSQDAGAIPIVDKCGLLHLVLYCKSG